MTMRLRVLLDGDERGLSNSASRARKDIRGVRTEADRTSKAVDSIKNSLVGLSGAIGGAFTIAQLSQFADEATNVRNRLRDVTESTEEFTEVQRLVSQVAEESRSSLTSTATLYSRLDRAAGDLVGSNEELAGVVRTINRTFALSGATAQEAEAAIIQLSQGLQAGVLRGDEFNSVAEQAPGILKAVEQQTGKTRAEIRAMAADGAITSELLITSIQNYADEVDRRFAQTEATISQAFTVARNEITDYIGALDESSGISNAFGEGITNLSGNLDGLTNALVTIVGIGLLPYARSLGAAAIAKAALIRNALAATPAVSAANVAMGIGAQRATALTVATNALNLSMRGLSATLGFLAGPAGILLLAAGAVAYYATQANDATPENDEFNDSLRETVKTFRELNAAGREASLANVNSQITDTIRQMTALEENLDQLKQDVSQGGLSGVLEGSGDITETEQKIASLNRQLQQLQATRDDLSRIDSASTSRETTASTGSNDSLTKAIEQFQAETEALDAQLQIQRQVRDGHLTQEEGQIFGSFVRREQQTRDHFDRLQTQVEEHYTAEAERALGNKDRIAAIELEKQTRLEELERARNERQLIMAQEQHMALEQANMGFLERFAEAMRVSSEDFQTMWGNTFDRFAQGIGDATATAITEQKSLSDAAKSVFKSIIQQTISGLVQLGVKYVAQKAIMAAADKTTAATSVATAVGTGASTAVAWAPAAALASLATAGANAVPAKIALGTTTALSKGLAISGMAHDGLGRVPAANEGTFLLRRGEMVLNPTQRENFEDMVGYARGNGGKNAGNANVTIQNKIDIVIEGSATEDTPNQIEAAVDASTRRMRAELAEDFSNGGPLATRLKSNGMVQ